MKVMWQLCEMCTSFGLSYQAILLNIVLQYGVEYRARVWCGSRILLANCPLEPWTVNSQVTPCNAEPSDFL